VIFLLDVVFIMNMEGIILLMPRPTFITIIKRKVEEWKQAEEI